MRPPGAHHASINADAIPVAKTPPGGYGDTFPGPVLATCTKANGLNDVAVVDKATPHRFTEGTS